MIEVADNSTITVTVTELSQISFSLTHLLSLLNFFQ